MKKFNLLALVVFVSVNILTPISYAGDISENNSEVVENVVENSLLENQNDNNIENNNEEIVENLEVMPEIQEESLLKMIDIENEKIDDIQDKDREGNTQEGIKTLSTTQEGKIFYENEEPGEDKELLKNDIEDITLDIAAEQRTPPGIIAIAEGIYHNVDSGYIELTYEDETIRIRDKNVNAENSLYGSPAYELSVLVRNMCHESSMATTNLDLSLMASYVCDDGFAEQATAIAKTAIEDYSQAMEYILNYTDYKTFGDYFYRGNNSGVSYDKLGVNCGGELTSYSTTQGISYEPGCLWNPSVYETGANLDNKGWDEGNFDNPCNGTGEYLPTPEDWEELIQLYAVINGIEYLYYHGDDGIEFNFPQSLSFRAGQDLLLPNAGYGFSQGYIDTPQSPKSLGISAGIYTPSMFYTGAYYLRAGSENESLSQNEVIGSISTYGLYSFLKDNVPPDMKNIVVPVRCFMIANPVTVVFDTDEGSDVNPYTVKSGTTISEPVAPTKTGYTFEGWYTEDGEEWNFDTDVVERDMILRAEWRLCGAGFTVKGNKCIPEGINLEGLIEVSDGIDTVYIKDRNEGAMNIILTDKTYNDIIDLIGNMCVVTYDDEYNELCTNDMIDCNSYAHKHCPDKFFEEVSDIIKYEVKNIEELDMFIATYQHESSFGNYYFRGNNSGTNFSELELSGYDNNYYGYFVKNVTDLNEKFLEGGKINNSEGNGWIKGNQQNNPCDGEGEYLPTVEDWTNLIRIWMNKKGYNFGEMNPIVVPISPDEQLHSMGQNLDTLQAEPGIFPSPMIANEFEQDMLISYAGSIIYNKCPEENNAGSEVAKIGCTSSMYYRDSGPVRRTAQSGGRVGIFSLFGIDVYTVEDAVNMGLNEEAFPVRCFVKMDIPEVLVVRLISFGQDTREINVISGEKLPELEIPSKTGYTFDGWYEDEAFTKSFDVKNDKITEDKTLYAKWNKIENKPSGNGGSSGGSSGGGSKDNSSTNKDNQSDKTPTETQNDKENDIKSEINANQPNGVKNEESSNISVDYSDKSSGGQQYTEEFQEAYNFAHKNGITTMPTIEKANMYSPLTRIQMAKMLSQYAINVLGKKPDTSRIANFYDVSAKKDREYNNGVTLAYQLGIMGINMPNDNFRPDDIVTRGEFATAFSRMLYNTSDGQYRSTAIYYTLHMSKLRNEGIIKSDIAPKTEERRGYVMIMLMRSIK